MYLDLIVSNSEPLCIVGGASASHAVLGQVAPFVAAYVGVDGGADTLLDAGIGPVAVIGDLDSLSDQARAAYADVLHHFTDQSTTDFEKTLASVAAPALVAVGFTGGRMDHILSVLSVMRTQPDKRVILLDDHDVSFFAGIGVTELDLPKDARVSVMPVHPARVSLSGVVWPFVDQPMQMGGFTSPSNAALGGKVTIAVDAPVLVTLPQAFLAVALQAVVRAQ